MAKTNIMFLVSLFLILTIISVPLLLIAVSSCNGPCQTQDDCSSQLICINGKCNDDPNVGTHICTGGSLAPLSNDNCKPSGILRCNGKSFPNFTCSPPITSLTKASLTLNDFRKAGDGGAPSECDENFHEKTGLVVAHPLTSPGS